MKPLSKVSIKWSSAFAYVIGLIATDGSLSCDGRHIVFTSKDIQLAKLFKKLLLLKNKIGRKARGRETEKRYFVVQFGDVNFYKFLVKIGLTPNKSTTIGKLLIPKKYFFDFLRGCIDGDGNIQTFSHPESRNRQLRVRLVSASRPFLVWIQESTLRCGIKGYFKSGKSVVILEYAMGSSKKLLNLLYYPDFKYCLRRKYNLAKKYAGVAELA